LLIDSVKSDATGTPTLTEIQVYNNNSTENPQQPTTSITSATYDLNPSKQNEPANQVTWDVYLNGDTLSTIRYIGTEGNVLSSLTEGKDYTVNGDTYTLTRSFLTSRAVGKSGLQLEFASGAQLKIDLNIINSTDT